jgi:hypothetical protein
LDSLRGTTSWNGETVVLLTGDEASADSLSSSDEIEPKSEV